MGTLKAKLAKYRAQLLEPTGKKGEKGEGFDVLKSGDARVAMIGFPSVGKVRKVLLFKTQMNGIRLQMVQSCCESIPSICHHKSKLIVDSFQSTLLSTITKTESVQASPIRR